MRVALGWKAHSGWAALVAVGGDAREPHVVERARIALVPDDEPFAKAPYHAGERVGGAEAREIAERGVASVQQYVPGAIQRVLKRCTDAGHAVCGCAVLVGSGMPAWTTDEILAVHFRMHKAEGELFRDALVAGTRACGLALTTLPDKSALDAAAKALATTRTKLDATLAALGKIAGAPWGKDQKEAAAAALVALAKA
ncbi:MAG: hypothetical protein FJ091_14160 [Deltaproteobacteria bacterium]|nr:hypothetical protein [Deltaproteobacteria bacterium]